MNVAGSTIYELQISAKVGISVGTAKLHVSRHHRDDFIIPKNSKIKSFKFFQDWISQKTNSTKHRKLNGKTERKNTKIKKSL